MQNEQLVSKLNDKRMKTRLKALKALTQDSSSQTLVMEKDNNINCVFRTVYSCFDRSPSLAVYYTYKFGMPLTGIVD